MKRLIVAVLCTVGTLAHAQAAKKELVQKVLALQQPMIESVSRNIAERPAMQLMQFSGQFIQTQVPADKREALAKQVESDIRKFVDEAVPVLRERALKLAPSTLGTTLEEKFTDDELKQMITWLESPANKKLQQLGPEMQSSFAQKLTAEAAPLLDPKLQTLQQKLRSTLGVPEPGGASASAPAKPAASAAKARK